MERIIIFDTTLRDGEQSPGVALTKEEKLEIAKQLERLGVDVIEAGFPMTSPGDFEAVRTIAREVRNCTIAALTHANPESVDVTWDAIKEAADPRIHVFLSSSDIHLAHQLRKSREEVLELAVAMVRRAARYTSNVEFSPMDATRSDPRFVYQILTEVIEAGATTVNIPDTVGYATPEEFYALIRGVFENVPNIHKAVVSVHCHDDLGMAVANSLAGIRAGARQVEGTINGIGERAGNAALEEIIMALHTRRDFYGFTTRINTREIARTSRLVSDLTGMVVQPNKAIVGMNAFRHQSGIHQDGVLKERTTYEIMDPKDIGLTSSQLVLGKNSGRHAFRARLLELGYDLGPEELRRAFARFKEIADRKKQVTDRDLIAIVSDEIQAQHVEHYRLEAVQVHTGDRIVPVATVTVVSPDGRSVTEVASGNGPVDAICNAIIRAVRIPARLVDFSVRAVTEGGDAVGEVSVIIEHEGRQVPGRGVATDIIVASARAFINAINRLISSYEAAGRNVPIGTP